MPPPRRKTMRRWEYAGQARYLTFSCYRRLPLLSNDRIKRAFVDRLAAVRRERPFRLFAWVILPEHIHLIILPDLPDHPVSQFVHSLKRPVAERVLNRWRQLEAPILPRPRGPSGRTRFWQAGGGYDRNIRSEEDLIRKIEYIHDNPVRRGLALRQSDYPWSSARWYDGPRDGTLKIDPWYDP